MKPDEDFKKLEQQISRINQMANIIQEQPSQIAVIEIDILMEELRKLYGVCLALKDKTIEIEHDASKTSTPAEAQRAVNQDDKTKKPLEDQPPSAVAPAIKPMEKSQIEKPIEAIEAAEEVQEKQQQKQPTQEAEPLAEKQVIAVPEQKSAPAEKVEASQSTSKPAKKTTQKEPQKSEEKKVLGETLKQSSGKSINDLISDKFFDQSIAGRMQHTPISNLKTAIGINERFSFANELFDGDMNIFNNEIEELNQMANRNEAINRMEELRSIYKWDIESIAFQKLIDMVSRRYS